MAAQTGCECKEACECVMQAEMRLRSAHSTGLAHAMYALCGGMGLLYEHENFRGLA